MIVRSASAFVAPVLAVLVLGALTACSPSTNSTGGAATTGGGSSADTNVCTLISASAAGSATGQTYTGAKSGTFAAHEDSCTYATSGTPAALIVTVYEPGAGTDWKTLVGVLESLGPAKSVSGVGDQASLGGSQLDVEAGSRLIAIEGDSVGANPSGAEALAKKLISALG